MSKRLTVVTDDSEAKWVGALLRASDSHDDLHVDVKQGLPCDAERHCSGVLIDINGMTDGLSYLKCYHRTSPHANIFVTESAAPWEDLREAYRSGATDVIPKEGLEDPEEIDSLLKRIVAMPRVLLADNNDALRETWRDLLSDEFDVVEAASPEAAKSALAANDIDLAILDIRLVDDSDELDTSGLEVAKESARSTPVVFLTNYPTQESVRTALRRRLNGRRLAVEFIHKHEPVDVLLNAVKRVVHSRAMESASDESHSHDLHRVMLQLRQTREEISSSYHDIVGREHAWRAFQKVATESLWAAVKDLENDTYRRQIADVLDAAVAKIQAFQLGEEHLSAIDFNLSHLSSSTVDEVDVDACEDAWRAIGVDTLPSLKDALEEWLANSEERLGHVG